MKPSIKDILPEEGLGQIKFGMFPKDLEAIIGKANEVEELEEDEVKDIAWHYDELSLSFTFNVAGETLYLETIAVTDDYYEFMGERLIGLSQIKLLRELELLDVGETEINISEDETSVIIEEIGVIFWMEDGLVAEIQWAADM